MSFLGKWTWTVGSDAVCIDPQTGALVVAAQPSDGSDRFNAYGNASAFTLQASNGDYVALNGTTYVADKASTDPINRFTLEDDGSGASRVVDLGVSRVVDLGAADRRLWNRNGGKLEPLASSASPPASTVFTTVVVTPGIEAILSSGFTSPQPDLSWVDLAGTDFTSAANLDLTQADLSNADLSDAAFPQGTPFQTAVAPNATFAGASLVDCQFGSATLTSATFSKAKMSGVDLNGADLSRATLNEADLRQAANLANATFSDGTLQNADFGGTLNIYQTSFAGADLSGANFAGASVTGSMDITGANLTGATLCNPPDSVTVFPGYLRVDAKTNFSRATLTYLDFSGYDLTDLNFAHADLTGCKLDNAQLDRTNFGFATLDGASITGGVSMHGANLASASLRGADLTGAQLGAVSQLFRVGSTAAAYDAFLAALRNGDATGVKAVFDANKRPLTGAVTIRAMVFAPDTAWQVQDASNQYSVLLETLGGDTSLDVYQPTTPAVLANAFLVDIDLKAANLFGVRASGAQLYATAGNKVNLNQAKVNGLQANNANLGGIDLSQANLAGCNFDYAVLTGADLSGASLSVDANGGQPSFNGANLQGANLGSATVRDVILANAAVAVVNPHDPAAAAGVWLFGLGPEQASLIVPQLDAASPDPSATPPDPEHVFAIPIELLPTLTTGSVPRGLVAAFAEAGIKLAPDALLIVLTTELFWQVRDGAASYVVFRSVDTDYRPALGVATGTSYTVSADFYLPLSVEASFRNGLAATSVRDAFASAGTPLGTAATVTTGQHPIVWQVITGADTYTLWIVFDSSVLGVDTTITARASIPNVISMFGESSIALSTRASITRIGSGGWTIDNDAENPFNTARGYIEFNVLPNAGDGLDVYGSVIRIVRASAPGVQEYTNIPCAPTQLSIRELGAAANTVCPNGATVAANQGDGLPFEQWLWASYLPRPPVCVPDPQGKFFCPT